VEKVPTKRLSDRKEKKSSQLKDQTKSSHELFSMNDCKVWEVMFTFLKQTQSIVIVNIAKGIHIEYFETSQCFILVTEVAGKLCCLYFKMCM
jgi:hypothetical protein